MRDDLIWLRGVCERRGVPLIRRDTEEVIRNVLASCKPARILEIGTALGYSACLMASILPEAAVTTIEIYDRSYYDAREAIARLGLSDRIEQRLGDAADLLPVLAAEGRRFDLAFIDAAKSHYRVYFEGALSMMESGGVILCDNLMLGATLEEPGKNDRRHRTSARQMERFIEELRRDSRVATTFYECGDGLSVSRIR
ncbi:MAG: O-methyltransferase [Clostridiales bacterium]|nr:O-methyltransferase [Clostridiales bacterium]